MADNTKVDYADATVNVVTGCSKVSSGCAHCCAERSFARLSANPKAGRYFGRQFGDVQVHMEALLQACKWTRPRTILMPVMGDLFHDQVAIEDIAAIIQTAGAAKQHRFLITTKRPERFAELEQHCAKVGVECWPDNVWPGVSVEGVDVQDRIDHLTWLAGHHHSWVSFAPLVRPVDIYHLDLQLNVGRGISWVVIECESGAEAREMDLHWAREIIDVCRERGIPVFLKQAKINGELVKMPALDGVVYAETPWGRK